MKTFKFSLTCIMTNNVNKKKVVPDLIFFTAQRSENMFYIFTSENITFSKYAFYFINNSLYFITLFIINYMYFSNNLIPVSPLFGTECM